MDWKITLKDSATGAELAKEVTPTPDEDAILKVFRAARSASGGALPPWQLDVRHAYN
jgi:hypothetical protein